MKKLSSVFAFLVVVILSMGAVRPLLSSGFFPMHDDVQPARVIAMSRALAEGQFPVRWVADLGYGYGYPLFHFYGPLPYYMGGAAHLITRDAVVATKVMMGVGMILAAVSMYVLVSRWLPFWPALATSVLYMYAPYHGLQLYVRGAVGELWAYGFLPLVVAGVSGNVALGIVGLAGVITSHTIIGFLTAGLVIASYVLRVLLTRDKKTLRRYGFMILFGLGLSAFFWLPAISEMQFTNVAGQVGGGADFRDHFVCIDQLWQSAWGYGGSAPGCIDGMSFKIGKLHIILGLAGLLMFLGKLKPGVAIFTSLHKYFSKIVQVRPRPSSGSKIHWQTLGFIGILLTGGSVFFMTPISQAVWEAIPYAAFVQYPWRLLAFGSLGLVLLSTYIWQRLPARLALYGAAATIALTLIVNAEAFLPLYLHERASSDFENAYELRFRASRVSDEYMPPDFVRPAREADVARDTIAGTATSGSLHVALEEQSDITLQRAYFPGWRYWVDGEETTPRRVAGLPVFSLTPGEHTIEFRLTDTPVRQVGNMITLVSVILLGVWYAKNKKAIA